MQPIIYRSVRTIEVAPEDFPQKMNWEDAKQACESLGEGWRLPTRDEMEEMYQVFYRQQLGNFEPEGHYWLLEHNTLGMLKDSFMFYAGYEYKTKFQKYCVRAVRSTKQLTIDPVVL